MQGARSESNPYFICQLLNLINYRQQTLRYQHLVDKRWSYQQLVDNLQYPGILHLQAAERVLCAGPIPGNVLLCPGGDTKNKLIGWLESDPDTQKSRTGYLMSLNAGAISCKSSPQEGVTLSSSEAEFAVASQAGQEVLYLRVLLKGFVSAPKKPTQIWEDNQACPCRGTLSLRECH